MYCNFSRMKHFSLQQPNILYKPSPFWCLCDCLCFCLCAFELSFSFGRSDSSGPVHLFSGSLFNPALPEFPPAGSFDSALSRLLWDAAEILQIYWSQMVLRATQSDTLNHLQPQNPCFKPRLSMHVVQTLFRPSSFSLHFFSACFLCLCLVRQHPRLKGIKVCLTSFLLRCTLMIGPTIKCIRYPAFDGFERSLVC